MTWPRRAADGSVVDLAPGPDPLELERVTVVLAALRLLGAAGLCGESFHAGQSGRVVRVEISCDRPDCSTCSTESGADGRPESEARAADRTEPEPGEASVE
jgi:hypothetical protein